MASPLTVVVGSLAMNLVVRVQGELSRGRCIAGGDLAMVSAGGGADLAVAIAKLGAHTHLVGRVGADDLGNQLLATLDAASVATGFVTVTEGVATGTRIVLEPAAEGSPARPLMGEKPTVVGSAGANARLTPDDIDRALPLIRTAGVVVVEVGVPIQTVLHTIRICRRMRVPVVLDPMGWSPERGPAPAEMFDVTLLTLGEPDARAILGLGASRTGPSELKQICDDLVGKGAASVVLKEGDNGTLYASGDTASGVRLQVPGFKVKAKDPTGSGTAFTAALAIAHGEGKMPSEMLRFANAAAAVSSMHDGVQPSFPTRNDVDDLVRRWI